VQTVKSLRDAIANDKTDLADLSTKLARSNDELALLKQVRYDGVGDDVSFLRARVCVCTF
jgi:hypothetical protein